MRELFASGFVYQSEALFSADWLVPGVERRMWCVELSVLLFRKLRKCFWRMEATHNQGFCGGNCEGGIRSPGLPSATCSPNQQHLMLTGVGANIFSRPRIQCHRTKKQFRVQKKEMESEHSLPFSPP